MAKVLWLSLTLPLCVCVCVSNIFVCFLIKLLVQFMQELFPATKCQATKVYGIEFSLLLIPFPPPQNGLQTGHGSFLPSLHFYFHRSQIFVGWTVRDRIPVGTRFSARPDRPWDPPSLLCNGYRIFPGGKERPGRAADHSPPSSAEVMEE